MKKLYKLYDVREDPAIIGNYDKLQEVAKACNEWEAETDGDCKFELWKYNKQIDYYEIIEKWTYNNFTIKIK